jgi:predicted RNase H-like nuclease (RuvC/YqgF family)
MVGKETRNRSWHQERKSWEGIIEAVEDAKTGGTKMKFEVTGRKTIAKFVQALNDANAELAKTPASVDSALLADEKKKTKALTETVDVLNQEIQNIKSNSLSLVPINEALRQTVSSLNAEAGKARDKHYALEQEINTLKSKMDNRLLVANALIGALARTSV